MILKCGRQGQIMVLGLVFMGIIALAAVSFVEYEGVYVSQSRSGMQREKALTLAEAGINKAIAKLNQTGGSYSGETLTFGSGTVVITTTDLDTKNKLVEATAYIPNQTAPIARRKVTLQVSTEPPTDDVSFHYGVQVGDGGLEMSMNTQITGNIYSNGSFQGSGSSKSIITGDAWVAGSANFIADAKIMGDAHAHTISDSKVLGDAHYQVLDNTTVYGARHSGSADPAVQPFPISETNIADWKRAAAKGGTITGDYRPEEDVVNLGPKKITGNLIIDGGQTLVLTGTVWVEGYIDINNNSIVSIDPGYGLNSGVIITDKYINLDNNGVFSGSGHFNSFLLMIALGNCLGGTQTSNCGAGNSAVYLKNNVDSTIFYAPNGMVYLNNRVVVKEVTAYKMYLANNAEVIYDSGLANAIFSNGPSGSWQALAGVWQESP